MGLRRACSSVGRAFGSHPRGREFESLQVHHQAAPKKMPLRKAQKFQRLPGFFAPIFSSVTKRCQLPCQTNSMDLYLYPRHFEPLFRGFFGEAALFCPRQNVEFRPAFLLVLPNTHSKHRYQRVSRLCDVSDVKTAGKPHIPLQDETTAYWRCWDARKQSTRCQC